MNEKINLALHFWYCTLWPEKYCSWNDICASL